MVVQAEPTLSPTHILHTYDRATAAPLNITYVNENDDVSDHGPLAPFI